MPNLKWEKFEQSGIAKQDFHWLKKIILAFLAGVFVAMGYVAMIMIVGNDTGSSTLGLTKFFGSVIFCVGILMCMFVGACLFTANCSIYAGVLTKKCSRKVFYMDLLYTFIGNYLGSLFMACMIYGIGLLDSEGTSNLVRQISTTKIELSWWKTFLSAVITNFLVVGCVISLSIFENKVVGFLTTLVMITAFAICSYQHVVANMFITTIGGFYGIFDGNWGLLGKMFYQCILMSLLGNFAGGVFLTYCYYLVWNKLNVTTTIKGA